MIISNFYPVTGGSEISAQRFSQKLTEEYGWPMQVLTRRHGSGRHGLPTRDVVGGIPVTRVWSRGSKVGSLLYLLGGLWHLLRRGRGGIYHAHDMAVSPWIAIIAGYLLGGCSLNTSFVGLSVCCSALVESELRPIAIHVDL